MKQKAVTTNTLLFAAVLLAVPVYVGIKNALGSMNFWRELRGQSIIEFNGLSVSVFNMFLLDAFLWVWFFKRMFGIKLRHKDFYNAWRETRKNDKNIKF